LWKEVWIKATVVHIQAITTQWPYVPDNHASHLFLPPQLCVTVFQHFCTRTVNVSIIESWILMLYMSLLKSTAQENGEHPTLKNINKIKYMWIQWCQKNLISNLQNCPDSVHSPPWPNDRKSHCFYYLTKLICTPRLRWRAEQSRQMNTP
jgi:hypothetical protein